MPWTRTVDQLPPEGKYGLARHNRGTWHDYDQENVNCVVVKMLKGITTEERRALPDSDVPQTVLRVGRRLRQQPGAVLFQDVPVLPSSSARRSNSGCSSHPRTAYAPLRA